MKKKLTSTTILKETQLDSLKESLPALLGAELVGLLDRYGISIEKTTRFMSVQARCQKARSARGLSIRETANRLGIPQYQLKDIEAGRLKDIRAGVLEAYIRLLGLEAWFRRWRNANPELATELASRTSKEVDRDGGNKRSPLKRQLTRR